MIRSPAVRLGSLLLGLLAVLWVGGVAGCGQAVPRGPDVPAAVSAAALRAAHPPAADEAADLERRAHAAGIAGAEAKARGDLGEAERQDRLRAELGKLRLEAEQLAKRQQAQLDQAIAGLDAAAVLQRDEQDRRQVAAARAASDAEWRSRCRWIGLGGLIASLVLGAVIGWAASLPAGIGFASVGLVVSFACAGYGATVTWLPGAVLGLVVLGAAAWLVVHLRQGRVTLALSKTVDAFEGQAGITVEAAKRELKAAASRLGARLPRHVALRKAWRQ